MSLSYLASIPLTTSLTCGVVAAGLELAFRRKWWRGVERFAGERWAKKINDWIDYPQALAAGIILLSNSGRLTSGQAQAAAVSFVALPLLCKTVRSWAPQTVFCEPAEGVDHLMRLAAKTVHCVHACQLFVSTVQKRPLTKFSEYAINAWLASSSLACLIQDLVFTSSYFRSTMPCFYWAVKYM